jgi:hypothetical protein
MAAAVSADPDTALRVHTREELGLDPFDLPSALLAGGSSPSHRQRSRALSRTLSRALNGNSPAR